MRADRIHDGKDSLDIAYNDEWVLISSLTHHIFLLDIKEVVEDNNDVFYLHFSIGLMSIVEGFIDLVIHNLVPQTVLALVISSEVENFSGKISLYPLLEGGKLEDGCVGCNISEVGIVESITSICKCKSGGITTDLFDTLSNGHDITL